MIINIFISYRNRIKKSAFINALIKYYHKNNILCGYMWLYILYSIIVLVVTIYLIYSAYVKFNYPFWSRLHMHHSYNILNNFYWEGIINTDPLEKSKWTNDINIKTIKYEKVTNDQKNEIIEFMKINTVSNNNVAYKPTIKGVFSHYNAQNSHCFIGLYYEKHHNMHVKDIQNRINGIIMTRPLSVKINNKYFTTHLVENLVIKEDRRKDIERMGPELIHTIIYKQQQLHKDRTCIFKREGKLNIPTKTLFNYKTYFFPMISWNRAKMLPAIYQTISVNSKSLFTLKEVFKSIEDKFKCTILPTWTNIHELISSKNLLVYTLNSSETILAIYFFKDTCTTQSGSKTIECIASVNICRNDDIFIFGLSDILLDVRRTYESILIHDVSDSSILIRGILSKHKACDMVDNHVFLYNYIHPNLLSNKCFMIY